MGSGQSTEKKSPAKEIHPKESPLVTDSSIKESPVKEETPEEPAPVEKAAPEKPASVEKTFKKESISPK